MRDAFIAKGHDAWSCDLEPSEGNHIQGDVLSCLNDGWDMMIAHPPCTYLTVAGNRWYSHREDLIEEAVIFVRRLWDNWTIPKIALENPIGRLSTLWRKPDQIVQPWMFGEQYQKSTCLWLKNLPKLVPTNIVDKGEFVIHGGKKIPRWYSNRELNRDMTFQGIADAMASQWG